MEPYLPRIDIHTHILPGLDDGPFTLEDSIAMAHATALDGTNTIVATPHSRDMEIATSSPDKVNELADLLNTSLRNDSSKKNVPTIKILTGMCNHLTFTKLIAIGVQGRRRRHPEGEFPYPT